MLIFQKNKIFLKIIIILQIFSTLFTSSCMLKNMHQNHNLNFKQVNSQLKELIMPKEISIPMKNEEYSIPYQDKDLEEKNYNILPPV